MTNDQTLKWLRIIGKKFLQDMVKNENLFTSPKYILVYMHTDGKKSSRDIEKITGVRYKAVQSLWKKWTIAGISEPTKKYGGGRCQRLFELHELGVEIPQPIKANSIENETDGFTERRVGKE